MKRSPFLVGSLALLALACGGSESAGSGRVSVLIKDAPAAMQAAVVTITEIDLVGSSGTVVLSTARTTTDLLTLSNDAATLVNEAVVPVGTYSQLRFVITGGYLKVDGAIYASSPDYEGLPSGATVDGELRMPSYAQSGLKVNLPDGGLRVGTEAKVLVVDFDVSQSFGHVAGNSGAWVMHPVCKATDVLLTGALEISAALAPLSSLPVGTTLADFRVEVTPAAGGDVHSALLEDAGLGSFGARFPYLAPGDYLVAFQAPPSVTAFTVDPPVPATVTVREAQVTKAAFVISTTGGPEPLPL